MKNFIRRLIKFFAYTAAVVVILLAIAVGLFRLFMPRVPEYQDDIKSRVAAAIGMQVEFTGMDARWGLSGPELEFYDVELIAEDDGARIVEADEVRVGVDLIRLLFDQALAVDHLVVRDLSVDIRQGEDGSYRIQGIPVDELLALIRTRQQAVINIELIGEDIELRLMQPGDVRPQLFAVPELSVSFNENRIAVDADIRLPDEFGRQLSVSATQILSPPVDERRWDIIVDADDVSLPGLSRLFGGDRQFQSGIGDMELALVFAAGRIINATADLDFVDIALAGNNFFDIKGRVEVDVTDKDWLVAANEFVVSRQDHKWPRSTLRVEASTDKDGHVVMLDARASYLNFDDLQLLQPWLTRKQKAALDDFKPSGVIRNLVATVSEFDSDAPRFNISVELDRVGIADAPHRPGVRGFSGLVRANRAGGHLEIKSTKLEIHAPEYLPEAIAIDQAAGTIIWRNSSARTTILSDSIAISSEIFHSQSNVQLVLNKDGTSPEIDLASTWSIADLAEAKRYIPKKGLQPKLYDWFQMALVSGEITRATTTLNGPLDKFPFDAGEGRLLTEASVRNMTFKYHKEWPAAEHSDMEVILDNARLYTTQNRSVSAGIQVVNANIDIPDLRDPVLSIESFSASSLAAIREFSTHSPIAKIFGGQLDRVTMAGDASFTLNLTVPLKSDRVAQFEFVARVRSNNGTLAIDGFDPPITDLIGEVTIERERISSESLGATFLGQDVSISLARSDDPQFSVIATTLGTVTAAGIIEDLGAPLAGLVSGSTSYQARILFPSSQAATASPLTIQIDSDLAGLEFALPEPLSKTADSTLQVSGDIRFIPGGEVIESAGIAENRLAWQLAFNHPEDSWDFDRGVVTLHGDFTESPETRGLHIRGRADVVHLQDWLSLSRGGEKKVGAADRIRSIDVVIDDLYLIGQHLKGHHVRVDRSARDWLVQFDGDDVIGSVFVPYDFNGDRAMVLEMDRLYLPGDESEAESDSDSEPDPRGLPPVRLTVADFALGDRYLGAVEATFNRVEGGLEAVSIAAKDETFEVSGTGRWLADDSDPLGSHSFITATLNSSNVEKTMARLNYQPGISSQKMSMHFDLDWSGSPRADFFDVLDGKVQIQLGDGQLEEVEPGAGRMFGLMSIGALPRRLSLDFRDVFSKGLAFDKITGTFRIDDGKTYTCDLSLEGPAADVGIVGEADMARRTYDQTAIVSASVGNSLPIAGALVAGPQVAAVLLIFSQLFKKPLQEVGQVYYSIGGSWDEPAVESTDSAAFVNSGELAGCLDTGE